MTRPNVKVIELDGRPLFDVDRIVATPALQAKVDPVYAMTCLGQHMTGKWGLVCDEDAKANDAAVVNGERILSVYPLPDDAGEFWIITEADRSVTTFLLPSEY